MKKLFVDEIKKKGDMNLPGPGKYENDIDKRFGKTGVNYSIAKRLYMDNLFLDKSKKLPGPGFY